MTWEERLWVGIICRALSINVFIAGRRTAEWISMTSYAALCKLKIRFQSSQAADHTLCKIRWKLSQPVEAFDECWAVWYKYELFPTKPLLVDRPANHTLMLGTLSILRGKIIKPPTPPLTANILSKWYCRKSSVRWCVVLFQMKFHTNQHKILKISPNNVSSLSRLNINFRVC